MGTLDRPVKSYAGKIHYDGESVTVQTLIFSSGKVEHWKDGFKLIPKPPKNALRYAQ